MINNPQPTNIFTDILILSNGPGELTTWVYPFLKALAIEQQRSPETLAKIRISIALSPCQNASGKEAQLAQSFPNVERVLPQEQFFDFLLWSRTPNWEWAKQGIVIFLGGDQFFAIAIAKRLGYKTLIYAEWEARWYRWADLFAVRNQAIADKIPVEFRQKSTVIGDLMVDRVEPKSVSDSGSNLRICFMPGSKGHKLQIGVPLVVAIADILKQKRPELELAIALAPTTTPEGLAKYAQNSFPTDDSDGATATLIDENLVTAKGTVIKIHREFPAHALIQSSQLCITTVGANTAELAALNQPMIVLLPTNFVDMKVGWDGILGLLATAPVLGKFLRVLINSILITEIQKKGQLLAWPNIWAGAAIVPELLGDLTPTQVATEILFYLDHPNELTKMRDRLKQVCGQAGAATKLAEMVIKTL
ncbi:lipid-A-disaccharide synthase [Pseudanabaena galeata UHCC 0370]|uniref:Lipid-A-disaccharide synthase n=1 Tax=Pseudanabaena galeata UHCC 0370 TaxID=3110310 RepID=A0ABU5TNK3_9CYAN|nr:lipid-A-disaccharide synthase [Pseudanabaena galeata]MEA5479855.1 lipid-A-disaccharide synthase [Pseudanabaena galeata UHCC 0370]